MSNDSRPNLPPFPSSYRASGLLLHVTSLPSPYGIGDVGPAAIAWIDQLCDAGQTWWQALPLGPTGYGNSPYQALSSFAGNGLLISPDWLIEDGLLRSSDCAGVSFSRTTVDYDAIIQFKHRLLEKAWTNFSKARSVELSITFEQFCHEQADWLEDYALFRALKIRYNGAYYLEWPTELIQRVPKALAQVRRELANQIDQVRFAQFLLFRQGERLKKHAKAKGVRLIGDLPFFVSPDSSDVDRVGRKPLLLVGSVGMALTLGAMAIVFATASVGPDGKPLLSHMAAVAGLTAANLYIVAFAMSWGPVMWVLLGEMFPNQVRGAALAVSGATNWAANFAVTVTFLPLLSAVGLAGAYAFYAIAAAISLPFVWAAVRETKSKTLEQMKDTTNLNRFLGAMKGTQG
jgi:hypothetical protein